MKLNFSFSSFLPISSGVRNPAARNWNPASVSFGITVWQYAHSTLYLRLNIGIPGATPATDARKKTARATDLILAISNSFPAFPGAPGKRADEWQGRQQSAQSLDADSSGRLNPGKMMRMHQPRFSSVTGQCLRRKTRVRRPRSDGRPSRMSFCSGQLEQPGIPEERCQE